MIVVIKFAISVLFITVIHSGLVTATDREPPLTELNSRVTLPSRIASPTLAARSCFGPPRALLPPPGRCSASVAVVPPRLGSSSARCSHLASRCCRGA